MRRFALTLVLAAALLWPAASASADPSLGYGCSPSTSPPFSSAYCAGWHTGPVTIRWQFDSLQASPSAGNCSQQTLSADTAGTTVMCEVTDSAPSTTRKSVVIKIDRTPPVVTGMVPSRPPDHDGWWNHPVAVAFAGADATSGIASCDVVDFAGPGPTATGSCRDNAGNVATASFPLAYDAAPPAVTDLVVARSGTTALISWNAGDAVASQVVRSPGVQGARSSTIYGGSATSFADSGLKAGATYTYAVTAVDAAGNQSTETVAARPASGSAALSAATRNGGPPLLRWKHVRHATYYNVQVFRGTHKILSAWPRKARFQLPQRWRYGGHGYKASPGTYRWYVWPGFGPRSAHRYGASIGQSRFRIAR